MMADYVIPYWTTICALSIWQCVLRHENHSQRLALNKLSYNAF